MSQPVSQAVKVVGGGGVGAGSGGVARGEPPPAMIVISICMGFGADSELNSLVGAYNAWARAVEELREVNHQHQPAPYTNPRRILVKPWTQSGS